MRPVAFGYKCCWYVVQSTNKTAVADAIELNDRTSANWAEGIDAAYRYKSISVLRTPDRSLSNLVSFLGFSTKPVNAADKVFITPPVGKWTAIVGVSLRGDGTREMSCKSRDVGALIRKT